MSILRPVAAFTALLLIGAAPAQAQWGGWGGGWGRPGWGGYGGFGGRGLGADRVNTRDDREGKVDADTFVAQDASDQLGHGIVAVIAAPGGTPDASDEAAYEAAVVDQLVKVGYDTATPDPKGGQVVELRIIRDVLVPEEAKHKPVSGEATVGVSNYGSMVGVAIAVDGTKPRKALISTRMELTLRDRTTDKALWEGHAQIATREGDSHWNETAISTRLAAALFEHFPRASAVASR